MADLSKTFLYRMTHIDNMPHILKHGITHVSSDHANMNYKAIGDDSIISTRDNIVLPGGKKLGAFIPFYFGARMPMLYIIQRGYNDVPVTPAKDIVYCISSVQKIVDHNLPFLFTDGHAVDGLSAFYEQKDLPNIDKILDKEAINAKYWRNDEDLDLKRRKEAEFLVEADIPVSAIIGWIVFSEEVKQHLFSMEISEKMIYVKPACYF
ncbi:MAG TPA: DUF4433 domain-containing protein [Bacteroidales bacterium]|nr:MAG: hypothetical protein A2X11_16495 [Bacteroidetes bacterium GWE2_42_24]OFY26353.1 MAG: hypothetical protein A2X09_00200 [Bacteroidetes bacterium GWF2_43_11]HAQ65586.1 DUF4433 domain-containing protein [Bacteroidales bacterium]HBZ66891.1 DUF4433 domain-containing protein [Bacteroidales bacterium]